MEWWPFLIFHRGGLRIKVINNTYSLTLVAYVKAVGQVEAIAAVFLSLVIWKEREVLPQIPGMALVVLGIVLVLLG